MNRNLTHYLRLAGSTVLIALIASLIVLVVGWLDRWHTAILFSNGFFAAGGILIIIGVLSVFGGFSMRSDFKVLYSQSAGDMSLSDRSRLWVADITQGYGVLIMLAISGLLLVGLSILVGRTAG